MNRLLLLAFAVHFSCASTVFADDYLLRLDTLGLVDRPAAERDPTETVLYSIEVVARPQSAFHARARIGTQQTLTLSGKLSPTDDDGFTLQIRYAHSYDNGVTVPSDDDARKTDVNTTIEIGLGVPKTVAGLDSETRQADIPNDKSKTRHVLLLSKYEMPDE